MAEVKPLRLAEILTLYTVFPLVFASIYGMNIPLPFQNESWAFLLYVGVCVLWFAAVTVFMLLRRRVPRQ